MSILWRAWRWLRRTTSRAYREREAAQWERVRAACAAWHRGIAIAEGREPPDPQPFFGLDRGAPNRLSGMRFGGTKHTNTGVRYR